MIGTLLIAIPGYGMALWGALGAIASAIDCARFAHDPQRRSKEARSAASCAIVALIFGGVTRWLLGGAL